MQFFGALKDQIGWWHLRRRACNGGGGLRLFAWPETLLSDSCLSGRNTQKFRDHFVRLAGRGVEEVRPGIGGGRRRANGVRQGGRRRWRSEFASAPPPGWLLLGPRMQPLRWNSSVSISATAAKYSVAMDVWFMDGQMWEGGKRWSSGKG